MHLEIATIGLSPYMVNSEREQVSTELSTMRKIAIETLERK